MTIRQFVEDTHDLTNRLRSRFNRSKIFLVARSWGSLIGIMTAKRYPQLYHAYVGIGQIVNPLEGDRRAYLLTLKLAREAGNEEAIADLKNIGQPPYNDQELVVQRKWLTKFYKNFMAEKFAMSNTNEDSFVDLLSTPEYS
ncbi:MAG: hypothetical protein GWN16_13580, partial [Calditrichae bacterium]|nr:hypothetical protein [Calditrichia bacterium]